MSYSPRPQISTEFQNWAVVAEVIEAAGATSSQTYFRARTLAEGKLDPMPTSFPVAPHSISGVADYSFKRLTNMRLYFLN